MKNRLRLDFSLETAEARSTFIDNYLNSEPFLTKPPTTSELEKIGDYLLWGKNEDGKASNADGALELRTAYTSKPVLSLDELMESPAFNEDQISPLNSIPTKTSKKAFSRASARTEAPPHILELLEALWREIDILDLLNNYYELRIGKRTEIRPELLERFSAEELQTYEARASKLSQYAYLKNRKLLVEKRREQFTLQDTYKTKLCRFIPRVYNSHEDPILDADIPVYPVGLIGSSQLREILFAEDLPAPCQKLSDKQKDLLNKLIWRPRSQKRYFDFEDVSHLSAFLKLWDELNASPDELPVDSTILNLYQTFDWYRSHANLNPIENEVLQLKIEHWQNQPIAEHINAKYNKTYNPNYISTIYNRRALSKIADVAITQREAVENIFFPENFKECKDCGAVLLLNSKNFVRRKSASDGYSPRCKRCERLVRLRREGKLVEEDL